MTDGIGTKIAAAIVKAQAEMPAAAKTGQNTHHRSRYADLLDIVDTARPVLAANGLAFVQTFDASEDAVTVRTILVHESGEMIDCGPLRLRPIKGDPQAAGSAITYARRYGLKAALGMVEANEDDDARAASAGESPDWRARARVLIDARPKSERAEYIAGVLGYKPDSFATMTDDECRQFVELAGAK